MSPDHHLSERIYLSLKADLLCGALPPGRLALASLEARYRSSATPVREALLRLVGENLIDFLKGGGFGISAFDLDHVRQLYDINRRVLGVIRTWHGNRLSVELPALAHTDEMGRAAGHLFLALASAVPNPNLPLLVANLNDRLSRIRVAEPRVLPDMSTEHAALCKLAHEGEKKPLIAAIDAYHRLRIRKAALIAQACDRPALR